MTSTPPEQPDPTEPPSPAQPGPEAGWGHAPPPPGYGQAPPGYGQAPPPPGYGPPPWVNPAAPYGVHPMTGVPYSDKQKLVAGLLQIFLPLGIGRFYMGQSSIGIAQLLVTIFTCGIGSLWSFIDGIVILAGDPKDEHGRPLRP